MNHPLGRLLVSMPIFILLLSVACSTEGPKDYPIQPVPFTQVQVQVQDQFWSPRMETNRSVTIPHAFEKCEETGRLDNFAIAGGVKTGVRNVCKST